MQMTGKFLCMVLDYFPAALAFERWDLLLSNVSAEIKICIRTPIHTYCCDRMYLVCEMTI